jgi:hypothetical protein
MCRFQQELSSLAGEPAFAGKLLRGASAGVPVTEPLLTAHCFNNPRPPSKQLPSNQPRSRWAHYVLKTTMATTPVQARPVVAPQTSPDFHAVLLSKLLDRDERCCDRTLYDPSAVLMSGVGGRGQHVEGE